MNSHPLTTPQTQGVVACKVSLLWKVDTREESPQAPEVSLESLGRRSRSWDPCVYLKQCGGGRALDGHFPWAQEIPHLVGGHS